MCAFDDTHHTMDEDVLGPAVSGRRAELSERRRPGRCGSGPGEDFLGNRTGTSVRLLSALDDEDEEEEEEERTMMMMVVFSCA